MIKKIKNYFYTVYGYLFLKMAHRQVLKNTVSLRCKHRIYHIKKNMASLFNIA